MNARTSAVIASCLLATSYAPSSQAAADPLLGEIMWVGYNFCPRGWAEANGQLLAISSNSALFSLLGTMYGGDGRTTFALPDLRGRVSISAGRGSGLSDYRQGSRGGNETTTLTAAQLPSHNHAATGLTGNIVANQQAGDQSAPANRVLADGQRAAIYSDLPAPSDQVDMHDSSVKITGNTANTGGGQGVNIVQPYLTLKACIATSGVFPSRS